VRLLIVRNPQSPLLEYLDTGAENIKVVLVQNGVYSDELRSNGALSLDNDVRARKLDVANDNRINYDELLDAVFQADNVLVV
jgi:sulfur transfer complex TusBCD TusB component (DsrH family)